MRFMIIGKATKESEAGVPPKPESIAGFFAEGAPPRSFELASTQAMPSGIILSTYTAAGPLATG